MNLIYSINYRGMLNNSVSSFENRFVDDKKLLTILERELGLYKSYSSNEARLKIFIKCLQSNAKDAFYSDSLKLNQFQLAKELLIFRDELIFFGWNNSISNQPKRFADFVKVNQEFTEHIGHEGEADRWLNILNALKPIDFCFQLF